MTIDLERSLGELARSVHDDALVDRLDGQVHRMVTRVRRRRAARQTGTAVLGVGAAAAVAVVGVQAAQQGDRGTPVATSGPDAAWPACGEAAPEATPERDLVLTGTAGPTAAYGAPVPLELFLVNAMSMSVDSYSDARVVVVQHGTVAGTAVADAGDFGLLPGVDPSATAIDVTPCDGTRLSDGDYAIVATVQLGLADGRTRTATSEPLPFTIEGDPVAADEAFDQAAAEAALADLRAAAVASAEGFGVCGSAVPDEVDAPVELSFTLDALERADGVIAVPVGVRASDAVPRDARLTAYNPQVVLVVDGVVVGALERSGPGVVIDLAPDGTGTVEARLSSALCSLPGADAGDAVLPGGVYQAYATFTLTIEETGPQAADAIPWEPVVVRSAPVEVTLGEG